MTRFEIEKMAQEANSAVEFHVDSTLNDMETFDDFKYGRPKKISTEFSSLTAQQSSFATQQTSLATQQTSFATQQTSFATEQTSSVMTTPLPYTAKGERRLREQLEREGRSPEEVNNNMFSTKM
jgi:hypothetical protein